MSKLDDSREIVFQEILERLTELTCQFGEADTLMGKVLRKNAVSGEGNAIAELSLAEIHFLAAVAEYAPINGTALTQKLGLTKGGVSKMAARLLHKEMIVSEKAEGNKKAQYYSLTVNGERASKIHTVLHAIAREAVLNALSGYSEQELQVFGKIAKGIAVAVEASSSDITENSQAYLERHGIKFA